MNKEDKETFKKRLDRGIVTLDSYSFLYLLVTVLREKKWIWLNTEDRETDTKNEALSRINAVVCGYTYFKS